ncbi:hypothetical protein SEA_JKERNS_53 [Arthrobacter phage JKerns]|uniref:Uncharacterized protein n=3 Tax=Marthavirus TaxID=1980936 RepID=A0A0U4B6L7_9CAUD|nr:hypothetical protein FDH50_gp52 [Arthrobacter phage Sonny]YP_009884274.1 hypothetical protein HYP98_gp53 [Arthrobacter phage Zartrosa]ALY10320.1 hypothetical protein SONNY_52 [Arthrobacter phage Sonny]QED11165.1 hypothetical protein SEA_ZARTROSA_53 [Arthrobacter phage Zartrosa]QIQ62865.1 hypothetical protein SEA_JKERNS_53 [Arthrobacter phage JKerns]
MKIIEQQQRSVTRHFLKIKIAEANSVPAGDDYVDGTTYTPTLIETSWRDSDEPESVRITGAIDNHVSHPISKGYMLSRLPIELEYVRDLVADGAEL